MPTSRHCARTITSFCDNHARRACVCEDAFALIESAREKSSLRVAFCCVFVWYCNRLSIWQYYGKCSSTRMKWMFGGFADDKIRTGSKHNTFLFCCSLLVRPPTSSHFIIINHILYIKLLHTIFFFFSLVPFSFVISSIWRVLTVQTKLKWNQINFHLYCMPLFNCVTFGDLVFCS